MKLTHKDLALLKAIAEHRILLVDQTAILNGTGRRAAQKKISELYKKGIINLSPRNFGQGRGRPENVCSLKEYGVKLLQNEGIIDSGLSIKRATGEEISNTEHELLLNWFRIHLLQIDKYIPDLNTEFISSKTPFLQLRENGLPLISDTVKRNNKDVLFIADGVFAIASKDQNQKLLFFLEIDMSTEPITSSNINTETISQKAQNYYTYFLNKGYKRYHKKWNFDFKGFRVLFLTNTAQRKETISRFLKEDSTFDFIWVSDQEMMFNQGISDNIWLRGGNISSPPESIIGPSYSQELILPKL